LSDESGLNRKNIVDNRVHCCFYFISPYGHGLKPLDIDFMKQLSNKVICDDFVFVLTGAKVFRIRMFSVQIRIRV
jgi:hypothetical protein